MLLLKLLGLLDRKHSFTQENTFQIIPDSVRWLSLNGRHLEAEKILLKMAEQNGRVVTPEQKEVISKVLKDTSDNEAEANNSSNPRDMFR